MPDPLPDPLPDKSVRLAVLGCGRIARRVHLPVLRGLPAAKITVLAEPDAANRDAAKAMVPDAATESDWRAALSRDDVDAVIVCLPTQLHAGAGAAALGAGKHLYLEKPIAIDAASAATLIAAADARPDLVAMAGFNYRFHAGAAALRDRIDRGDVGDLVGLRTLFASAPRDLPAWKTARASGGGVLLDLASHHVDLARFLTGREIESVSASIRGVRSEADTASVRLTLAGGLTVDIFASMCSAEQDRIEVLGDAGMLSYDRHSGRIDFAEPQRRYDRAGRLRDGVDLLAATPGRLRDALLPRGGTAHGPALSHFVNCVRLNRPPRVTLRDGAASLAAVLAAENSAETGEAVTLKEAAGPMPLPEPTVADLSPAPGGPSLSVVLVAADGYEGVRRVVRHVREQTVAGQIELLLVVPNESDAAPFDASETAGLHSSRVIATGGPIPNVDAAAAFGIRASAAPVVASVEDHAYPEPTWAAALLDAYRAPGGPWAAVGSTVCNANPGGSLSWANLLLAYGTWCEPVRRGPIGEVSQHNLSFRRAAIEPLFEALEERMGRTGNLMQELAARGGRFYIDPAARVHHLNPSRVGSTLALRFHGGRSYGATKASMAGWSRGKRAVYAALSPVIPLLRYRLIRPKAKAAGLRVMPAVALGLLLDGLGQAAGFAFGPGGTKQKLEAFEHDRLRHLTRRDREAVAR